MLSKPKSIFKRDDLTEENVIKQIHICLDMIFSHDSFAKDSVGVAVFRTREDLKGAFIKYIQNEMKRIVSSDNPHREFRGKIIKTVKVNVINYVLLSGEFNHSREKICEVINRGIQLSEKKDPLKQAMVPVKDTEKFSGLPWSYTKLVHETAWAQVEALVLRHLQIMIFENVINDSDWWGLFSQAYEKFITDFYRMIANKADVLLTGFLHPMLAAMGNETLMGMEDLILNEAGK